jgi:hypothetical protein
MALAAITAGPYTGAYDGTSVGQSQDGFRLRYNVNKEVVRSDLYGESVIDACVRGRDVFLIWMGIEYQYALAPFWPYAAFGVGEQAGVLDVGSGLASSMILTVVTGTTAVGAPNTLTGAQAIIDENFNGELAFRSGARTLPVTMRLYPYISSGLRWFSLT